MNVIERGYMSHFVFSACTLGVSPALHGGDHPKYVAIYKKGLFITTY